MSIFARSSQLSLTRAPDFNRTRLLDMTRRALPASLFASGLCGVAVVSLVSRVGPGILAPLAVGASAEVAIGFLFPRLRHPERWILAGDASTVVAIAWGVALTGGLTSPLVPLFALPVVAVAGRHTSPVVAWFTAACLAAPLVASLVAINRNIDYGAARIPAAFAAIGGVAAMTIALISAERHYRSQSRLDPLTGLMNRLALEHRFEELTTQATLSGGVVCLIEGDIDLFKSINDTYGHETGDLVLKDVAYSLRTSLRTFSLLYRIGGEEFIAILPGLSLSEGAAVAERLRVAVEECRPRGLPVTMSFGVAAAEGADVEYGSLFAAADASLYRAKRTGRNRVLGLELRAVGVNGIGARCGPEHREGVGSVVAGSTGRG
jgi:diguanylate cyclase (GGDEF)-like protein